jgi:hypothetical protein
MDVKRIGDWIVAHKFVAELDIFNYYFLKGNKTTLMLLVFMHLRYG